MYELSWLNSKKVVSTEDKTATRDTYQYMKKVTDMSGKEGLTCMVT